MKIVTKTILTVLTLMMFAQSSNAFTMQKVKDFLGYSTTKIIQSINNNKQAYIFGALAIGAAVGLGWWYYTSTFENQLVNEFDEILNQLTENNVNSSLLEELQDVKKILSEKHADLNRASRRLKAIQAKNKKTTFTEKDKIINFDTFIEEFIKKLKSQIHIDGIPYGLVNNNNSCFMNAAIQCLYSLDKCNNVLENSKYYKAGSLAESYLQLLTDMQKETHAVINPLSFCERGRKLFFTKEEFSQEDSPEFVQFLLESLIENDVSQSIWSNKKIKNNDLENLLKITVSETTYSEGKVSSRQVLTSPILPPIVIKDTHNTLSDCLRSSFTEVIPEKNHPSDPSRKIVKILESASNYFVIYLSRYGFNNDDKREQFKVERPISFELENFNIDECSRLSENPKKFPLYRCKAFIVHSGKPTGGHYTAYVRNNDTWFLCDDRTITPITSDVINNIAKQGIDRSGGTPVMFFYEQHPPSIITEVD